VTTVRLGRPSLIFRILRFLYFVLKGIGRREKEHYLFTIPDPQPMSDFELYTELAYHGWQPLYHGFVYKGQVYQCRRLTHGGRHQCHVRVYDDGRVTGHFETAAEYDVSDHLRGVDLRTMNQWEVEKLRQHLGLK